MSALDPVYQCPDEESFCPRDHGCSLPKGHDGECELTAALCFCATCEAAAAAVSRPGGETGE